MRGRGEKRGRDWERTSWRSRYVQPLVAETERTDIGGDDRNVKIGGPVAEGVRAAECKYCESEGVVDGHVAGHACEESGAAR